MEDGQKNITTFLGKRDRSFEPISAPSTPVAIRDTSREAEDAWSCARCHHTISLLEPTYDTMVQQHQDYHIALELSQTPETAHVTGITSGPTSKGAKRPKKDIRAFLKPR